ncbi:MAG: hypothetical protein PHU51_00325 [Candidatus Nanoarchaeia archaeon]|nr:hypothetical protein [Candidatus Nanoarchaeia archaeon]
MITINEFLEEDINNFLDEIKRSLSQVKTRPYDSQEVVFGVKDYEAEIRTALENNELIKAKLIYKDAKRAYGKLARNSPKRASMDLIIKKVYSQLVDFCNKHNLNLEDEQIEEKEVESGSSGFEGFDDQPKNKTPIQPATRTQQPERSNQNLASSTSSSVNVMSGSPILSVSSGLNFPINLPDLKEKQLREKLMLEFKQKLELESEREYENLQEKYKQERETMLLKVKKEMEENTKNEIQKLEQKLEQKFGEKYIQFKQKLSQENKTNNLTTVSRTQNAATRTQQPERSNQNPAPNVPLSDSSPDENFMVIEIIDKRLNLLKSLITKKDYEQAKSVFNKIKKELVNIAGYKKYKHKVYNILKNTYPLLNFKKSKEIPEIKEVEEIKSLPKQTTENLEELNKSYFEGISAIKTNNKSLALKIFLDLAKKHPNNKAIKIRLKEALTLGA